MSIRISQIDVFYPFFKTHGREIAAFYRFELFEDGTTHVMVPMTGRAFNGQGSEPRFEAHADLAAALSAVTGIPFVQTDAAMSQAWSGEARAYTLTG